MEGAFQALADRQRDRCSYCAAAAQARRTVCAKAAAHGARRGIRDQSGPRMIFKSPRRLGTRIVFSYVLLIAGATLLFAAGTAAVLFFQMRAQIRHFVVQDIENVEGLISLTRDGHVTVREDYHNHPESKHVLDYLLEIRSPDGATLYRNALLGNRTLGGPPAPDEGVGGYSERAARLADGTRVIIGSRRHAVDGRPLVIRLAESEEPVWHAVDEFLLSAVLIFPIMVGLAAFAAQRMSR